MAGDQSEFAAGGRELGRAAMDALESDREEAFEFVDLAAVETLTIAVVGSGGGDAAGVVDEDERPQSVERQSFFGEQVAKLHADR